MRHHLLTTLLIVMACGALAAQDQPSAPLVFDVVSIKRVEGLRDGSGMGTELDGTFRMTNGELGALLNMASPVPILFRDVVGIPDWMMRERYDMTLKPPAGLTREQLREQMPAMWRAMFTDRMQLAAHIEQREREVFFLVMARNDRRLGPDMKRSTLDCTPRPGERVTPPSQGSPSVQERQNRCGLSMSQGLIVSGGITMDRFVLSLGGLAGGTVENHTGLDGQYALTLHFSLNRQAGANNDLATDDAPDFFTALQEQLGLKVHREKKMMPVFVIDHVERPTPD